LRKASRKRNAIAFFVWDKLKLAEVVEPMGATDRGWEQMGARERGKVSVAVSKVWHPMSEIFC